MATARKAFCEDRQRLRSCPRACRYSARQTCGSAAGRTNFCMKGPMSWHGARAARSQFILICAWQNIEKSKHLADREERAVGELRRKRAAAISFKGAPSL